MVQLKGQSREPDVLDMGTPFAIKADQEKLLAPYTVSEWSDIPAAQRASDKTWWADYGGYVAIGYNSAVVKTPPTSFKDLLKPAYNHMVGINNSPTVAGAAFAAVFAAALSNGGSFNNILPGINLLRQAQHRGQFRPRHLGPVHRPERRHPHRHLVGLPAEVGNPSRSQDVEGRDPERRYLRLLLRPGDISQRPAPGRGEAMGGVPVLHRRPKPVAPGLLPPHRVVHHGGQRDRQPGRLQASCRRCPWVSRATRRKPKSAAPRT